MSETRGEWCCLSNIRASTLQLQTQHICIPISGTSGNGCWNHPVRWGSIRSGTNGSSVDLELYSSFGIHFDIGCCQMWYRNIQLRLLSLEVRPEYLYQDDLVGRAANQRGFPTFDSTSNANYQGSQNRTTLFNACLIMSNKYIDRVSRVFIHEYTYAYWLEQLQSPYLPFCSWTVTKILHSLPWISGTMPSFEVFLHRKCKPTGIYL